VADSPPQAQCGDCEDLAAGAGERWVVLGRISIPYHHISCYIPPPTVPEPKKLTFMYLANDVIQNSKKKGPEYGKEFNHVLGKVFAHIGEKW